MCLVSLGRTAKVGRWTRYILGYVPGFPGAHSQGGTLDALHRNLEEVIGMLLEDGEPPLDAQYVGTQTVTVP
jgi:predicted RNase H-like HicB family nuclease